MTYPIANAEEQPYSPQLDFQTPNQRKRTHSMADAPVYGISAQEQLQEYARGQAPTPNMAYPAATMYQAPVHGLPMPSGDDVKGIPPAILDG